MNARVDTRGRRDGTARVVWTAVAATTALAGTGHAAASAGVAPSATNLAMVVPGQVPSSRAGILAGFAASPLSFEANRGQGGAGVRHVAYGPGYAVFLRDAGLDLAVSSASRGRDSVLGTAGVVEVRFVGAAAHPDLHGLRPVQTGGARYLGHSPGRPTVRPAFAVASYSALYPGVSATVVGEAGQVREVLTVAPGARVGRIGLRFQGASRLEHTRSGDLALSVARGTLLVVHPMASQAVNGRNHAVAVSYREARNGTISLRVGRYDRRAALSIVVEQNIGAYLAANRVYAGFGTATDRSGTAYVAGYTPRGASTSGGSAVLVARLSAPSRTGQRSVVYTTVLGGRRGEAATAVAVDAAGTAYVTGVTTSPDFPLRTALQPRYGGNGDAFVVTLDRRGRLVYGTYIGGNQADAGTGIAVDGAGNVRITVDSASRDLPRAFEIVSRVRHGGVTAFVVRIGARPVRPVPSATAAGGTSAPGATVVATIVPAGTAASTATQTRSAATPIVALTTATVTSASSPTTTRTATAMSTSTATSTPTSTATSTTTTVPSATSTATARATTSPVATASSTAVPLPPGVTFTATGSVSTTSSAYFSEEDVNISNSQPLTALTIVVTVQKTPGVRFKEQYDNFRANELADTYSESATQIVYTYSLRAGQTVPPSTEELVGSQFYGNGTPHDYSGDTYAVTATTAGVMTTRSGHF